MSTRLEQTEHGPEALLVRARGGDRGALEQLVRSLRARVYGLALRTLGEPTEAEDATQEILFKVVTRMDSFRGESRFTTWVYAVASNHLRTLLVRRRKRRQLRNELVTEREARRLAEAGFQDIEQTVLVRELRPVCLLGVLVQLDRDHRLAYVLGEVLELTGAEGGRVLGIEPGTFRKRLSRARRRIRAYIAAHDEPVAMGHEERGCICKHLAQLDPDGLQARLEDLDELRRLRTLFRSLQRYRAPERLMDDLTRMLAVA